MGREAWVTVLPPGNQKPSNRLRRRVGGGVSGVTAGPRHQRMGGTVALRTARPGPGAAPSAQGRCSVESLAPLVPGVSCVPTVLLPKSARHAPWGSRAHHLISPDTAPH